MAKSGIERLTGDSYMAFTAYHAGIQARVVNKCASNSSPTTTLLPHLICDASRLWSSWSSCRAPVPNSSPAHLHLVATGLKDGHTNYLPPYVGCAESSESRTGGWRNTEPGEQRLRGFRRWRRPTALQGRLARCIRISALLTPIVYTAVAGKLPPRSTSPRRTSPMHACHFKLDGLQKAGLCEHCYPRAHTTSVHANSHDQEPKVPVD